MRKIFAPIVHHVTEVLYGPEPVGLAQARVLQLTTAAELNGQMGTPHYGMKGSPYEGSFTGLVASPQEFQGQAQMGASRNLSVQEYPALPAEQPPAALPTWLQDWDELEGVVPT
jgi:hypothetical protein